MDWVLLRDGDGSGSDSDDGGCRVRVPGGSGSASEDGSDSGFAIVRVRRSDRPAGAAVSPVGGVVSDAPAMVAVPRPTPPGFCFKVVSYGEPFSASSSSSTDGGSDFLDETTIREALFGAAACSRGAGIDDGDTVTHEEDRESDVGEHDGTGSSVEAPRTSSASRTSVSPCKALPEVASGVEEEDAESSGEEEDMENSGEEEENDDESSGEEDSEISEEEEEQDVDGESSSEDRFEIPATRHTAIDADDKGEQPAFPGRSYDDIDDSDDDMVPSSRTCTSHNAEQATGIEVPAPLFFWIDEDHQHDDIDTDTDMEEEGSLEPVCREYDGIDDSCGMEESGCGEECDDDDDVEGSEVEESGTEEEDCVQESDDEVATDADVEYGHNAENQRPEFVGRSYDDIDSGSDMEEEVATEPRASRVPRPLSEFFFERAARASPQVRLPRLPEFVCRSYDDIDSDCGEEDGAASSEAEESCCEEEEDDINCPEEEEHSDDDIDGGDGGESDSEVACDVNGSAVATSVVEEDQPAAESRAGRKYDDIDTSDSETDEGDRDSTASSDVEESDNDDDDDDAIPGVCGLCGHIVEFGKRPVEVGSITELYCCFDPEAVVRPARVVCKNGKAICIVYDDGEQSVYNPRPEAPASGGGAEEHVESVGSRYEYDDIDTDTEDGGAQFTAQAGRGRREEPALEDLKRRAMAEETPDVEDLLLEMLEEFEPAQPKHGDVDCHDTSGSDDDDIVDMEEEAPGVPGATIPRGPAGSCARTAEAQFTARWREQMLAQLMRQAAAEDEALESALQGGGERAATQQVTRRVEAESDSPPPAAHVQEEHAGQRSAGSPTADLTLCAMVYLLVYLATGGFDLF